MSWHEPKTNTLQQDIVYQRTRLKPEMGMGPFSSASADLAGPTWEVLSYCQFACVS